MQSFRHFLIPIATLLIYASLASISTSHKASVSSIYEALKAHDLPVGLLPKGVKNFSFDNSGKFEVHLDRACYAKFEDELHYDTNITGNLSEGRIDGLSGISAQDLFLWFPVIEIWVDIPSSGLIYFNVGVVSKQFSLSSFETPRDCLEAPGHNNLWDGVKAVESANKIRLRKEYNFDQDIDSRAIL